MLLLKNIALRYIDKLIALSKLIGCSQNFFFQFWSAFVPCATQNKDAVQLTLEQIDVIKRLIDKYPQFLQFSTSVTGKKIFFLIFFNHLKC